MFERREMVKLAIAVLTVGGVFAGTSIAQKATPKPPNRAALAEDEVKQLLLLMDTDKNGKISKQEFMKFMEEEFGRLDTNKDGELDVKELSHSQLRVSHPAAVGK